MTVISVATDDLGLREAAGEYAGEIVRLTRERDQLRKQASMIKGDLLRDRDRLRERVRVLEEANDRLRRFVADEDDRHVSAGGIHADPDL